MHILRICASRTFAFPAYDLVYSGQSQELQCGTPLESPSSVGVKRIEDVVAFQLAVEFKLEVYRLLRESPEAANDWRFRAQLSDAAAGVEMCLVEGWHRYIAGEFVTFLRYSRASLAEAEQWLGDGIARGYFKAPDVVSARTTASRCGAALTNLRKSLQPFTKRKRPRRP